MLFRSDWAGAHRIAATRWVGSLDAVTGHGDSDAAGDGPGAGIARVGRELLAGRACSGDTVRLKATEGSTGVVEDVAIASWGLAVVVREKVDNNGRREGKEGEENGGERELHVCCFEAVG